MDRKYVDACLTFHTYIRKVRHATIFGPFLINIKKYFPSVFPLRNFYFADQLPADYLPGHSAP